MTLAELGNAAQALEYLSQALSIYQESGDQDNAAITRANIDQLSAQ